MGVDALDSAQLQLLQADTRNRLFQATKGCLGYGWHDLVSDQRGSIVPTPIEEQRVRNEGYFSAGVLGIDAIEDRRSKLY